MSRWGRPAGAAAFILSLIATTGTAEAGHSYTELYSPLYVLGVALVVAVSFVLIGAVVKSSASTGFLGWEVGWWPAAGSVAARAVRTAAGVAGVTGLALVVVGGLAGSPIGAWNIAPLLVWVVMWKAMVAVQFFIGDVWRLLNPWATAFRWFGRELRRPVIYRSSLGAWPAVVLLLGVLWLEATTPVSRDPRTLSIIVLGYSVLTWTGMAVFGASVWLSRVECFTVFFRLLAAGAVFARTTPGDSRVVVRPPAVGLLAQPRPGTDVAVLILLVLGGGMFAALLETRSWEALRVGRGLAARGTAGENTLMFLAMMGLTLAVYAVSSALVRLAAGPAHGAGAVAVAFVYSLFPLAVGFHLVHGLDHTLENFQLVVRLASDPLGAGWDVFGTRTMPVMRPAPSFVWLMQLAVIVVVHVAGIWIAHARALGLYPDRGAAIRSQVPMIGVMVLFTVAGLWILSRIPIIL